MTKKITLKAIATETNAKSEALQVIADKALAAKETEQHKDQVKALHDAAHNAQARKKRLAKFNKASSKAQRYILDNASDYKSVILETSSIYAFDTLLTFVQAVTDSKIVNRECFYVFFKCFEKNNTVSAKEIQRQIMRNCISQTTKSNYTAESARTWTRNCFHAMNALSAMTEEKVSREIFYTLNTKAKFTLDLLANTNLIMNIADDELSEAVELELNI